MRPETDADVLEGHRITNPGPAGFQLPELVTVRILHRCPCAQPCARRVRPGLPVAAGWRRKPGSGEIPPEPKKPVLAATGFTRQGVEKGWPVAHRPSLSGGSWQRAAERAERQESWGEL